MEESNKIYPKVKTHIVLPFLFILTLTISICMLTIDDFTLELSGFIVWFYVIICMFYCAIAIFDLFYNKQREKKQKIFISLMSILTIIACVLYIIFYLMVRGK